MSKIVVYDPGAAVVDAVIEYNPSANTPDYNSEPNKLVNPDLSLLEGIVPVLYWKRVGTTVVEMNQTEKETIDPQVAEETLLNEGAYDPPTENAGWEVDRGGTDPNASLMWNETTNQWEFGTIGNIQPLGSIQVQEEGVDLADFAKTVNFVGTGVTAVDSGSNVTTVTITAGGGDVTAGANITDNRIVRGDGGAKGIQDSAWTIGDNGNLSASFGLPAESFMINIQNTTASGEFMQMDNFNGNRAIEFRQNSSGDGSITVYMDVSGQMYFDVEDGVVKIGETANSVNLAYTLLIDHGNIGISNTLDDIVGIDVPAGAFTDWTLTLPTGPGTNGQVLTTDGSGNTSWSAKTTDTGITQLTGDVTAGPGSGSQVATIPAETVDNTQLAHMAANTVKARQASSTGDPLDVLIGANQVLGRQGGNIVAAQVATDQIANDAVTYAKMQNVVADDVLLGNIAGAGGVVAELTATQVRTLLNVENGAAADQNLWLNVAGDTGSTAANTTTDTLTIAGGTGITTAMSGDTLTITASGGGDVSSSANIVDHSIVRGDGGVKGVQDSEQGTTSWTIADNGKLVGIGDNSGDYIMTLRNLNATSGSGFMVQAGEALGDLAFSIQDSDGSFIIIEMEADQGFVTIGKSYAQTLIDNGIVYGLDNQNTGTPGTNAVGFNTAADTYRIAGVDVIVPTGGTTGQVLEKVDGTSYNMQWADASLPDNPTIGGDEKLTLPTGTTAQRPSSPVNGDVRYNTTTNKVEAYENGTWINFRQEDVILARYAFFADQVEYPTGTNWNVNVGAPASADSNNSALTVRLFDDSIDEAIGMTIAIPSNATNMMVETKARAETAPGATQNAILVFHKREIPDNAAVGTWSTNTLTTVALPTNENFQFDVTDQSLATWGLTAGSSYQIQISRDANNGSDTLVGDLALYEVEITFT